MSKPKVRLLKTDGALSWEIIHNDKLVASGKGLPSLEMIKRHEQRIARKEAA